MTGTAKELVFILAKIADEDTTVYDLVEHKEKRTLNQNGYYWSLLDKVANKAKVSKNRLHNDMLQHYGQRMFIDGQCVYVTIPDTEECENGAMESSTVHLKPTSKVMSGRDGVNYRTWVMMRGSHDYDTREMSVLLDGLIQEARQYPDIEVMTPNQLAEMRRLEQMAEDRRNAQKDKSITDKPEG